MGKKLFLHTYEDIISIENLLEAWQEFVIGKASRQDVEEFGYGLMANLFSLHERLASQTYQHDPYEAFTIRDPKTRSIHKASVTDRVLHRALYRKLYPFFDRMFIADSFSCRNEKGTHKALDRFRSFGRKVSKNQTKTAWVLKCDVRKFFASIDQKILLSLLDDVIADKRIVGLLEKIIGSFHTTKEGVGLPLGNLTSQLFSNVYLNELDQFAKHFLEAKYYIRYADDFVFLSEDKLYLQSILPLVEGFLHERLHLSLHPNKVFLKTIASGVDFLGWVHFNDHRILRATTKRRMMKALSIGVSDPAFSSYCGMLKHGNAWKLSRCIGEMRGREVS